MRHEPAHFDIETTYTRFNLNRMSKAGAIVWAKGSGDIYYITIRTTDAGDGEFLNILWKNVFVVFQALDKQGVPVYGDADYTQERDRIAREKLDEVTYEIRGIGHLEALANHGVIFPDFMYYKTTSWTTGEILLSAFEGTLFGRAAERLMKACNATPYSEYVLGIPR